MPLTVKELRDHLDAIEAWVEQARDQLAGKDGSEPIGDQDLKAILKDPPATTSAGACQPI